MRRVLVVAICGLAMVFANFSATAQIAGSGGSSLTIGGTVLRLGDPKPQVLAKLAKDYSVEATTLSSGDAWFVKNKEDSTSDIYGFIRFDKGSLANATKYWLPTQAQRPEEVVLAVYGIVEGFVRQGNKSCTISADEHDSPGPVKETKVVFVVCGPKTLSVSMSRLADSVSVDVSEALSNGPPPKLGNY